MTSFVPPSPVSPLQSPPTESHTSWFTRFAWAVGALIVLGAIAYGAMYFLAPKPEGTIWFSGTEAEGYPAVKMASLAMLDSETVLSFDEVKRGAIVEAVPSPDGTKIAFVANLNEGPQVFVKDGSGLSQISTSVSPKKWVSWSPDGEGVLFSESPRLDPPVSRLLPDAWRIQRVNLADKSATSIGVGTHAVALPGSEVLALTNRGVEAYSPAGAPKLVLASAGKVFSDTAFAVSPGGTMIAWVPSDGSLQVFSRDGSGKIRPVVFQTAIYAETILFSPDGEWLLLAKPELKDDDTHETTLVGFNIAKQKSVPLGSLLERITPFTWTYDAAQN